MMDEKKQTLSNIYDTLVQIRYPNITTATVENIEITILNGGNRISLLSWLLTETDEKIAVELQKFKGPDLEDKLVQYYSKIGLCNDKDVLLGNCTLEEQLPTLNLLLEFIKMMFVKSSNDEDVKVESIDDILQVLNNDSSGTILSVADPKLDYSKSLKYFDDVQKVLNEHQNLSSHSEDDKEQSMEEIEVSLEYIPEEINLVNNSSWKHLYDLNNRKLRILEPVILTGPVNLALNCSHQFLSEMHKILSLLNYNKEKYKSMIQLQEEKEAISENDRDAMLTSEKMKFLEAFSLDSLPAAKEKSINTLYSMDSDIKDLYSNFSSLTEFLRARDEISGTTIPDGIEKMATPLTKVIEDILISTEAIMNMHNNS